MVIATIRSECCLGSVTYTGNHRLFHGLMGSESEPEIFCHRGRGGGGMTSRVYTRPPPPQ